MHSFMQELYGYNALENEEVIELSRGKTVSSIVLKCGWIRKKVNNYVYTWGEIGDIMTAIFLLAMQ